MTFRRFVLTYAARFRHTERQGAEIVKILASDPRHEQDIKASGRGPLSGPDATSYNGAKFVLALLGGGPQLEAPTTVANYYQIATEGSDTGEGELLSDNIAPREDALCKVTGELAFGGAVKAILDNPKLADQIERVLIQRETQDATIIARDGRTQRFVDGYTARQNAALDEQGDMRVEASIGGRLLAEMARSIRE